MIAINNKLFNSTLNWNRITLLYSKVFQVLNLIHVTNTKKNETSVLHFFSFLGNSIQF